MTNPTEKRERDAAPVGQYIENLSKISDEVPSVEVVSPSSIDGLGDPQIGEKQEDFEQTDDPAVIDVSADKVSLESKDVTGVKTADPGAPGEKRKPNNNPAMFNSKILFVGGAINRDGGYAHIWPVQNGDLKSERWTYHYPLMETKLQTKPTSKKDRLNELVGVEMECKLKVVGQPQISSVAGVIFRAIGASVGPYQIAPSLATIGLSRTTVRHYGYQVGNGKIRKAFAVTEREKDGMLQIKRKGPKIVYKRNVLSKPELVEPLSWNHWSTETELAVINQVVHSLDDQVYPNQIFLIIGKVHRQKLKIRVINAPNGRTYTIGVDETTAPNGKTLQQIEIEYVGTEPAVLPFERTTQLIASPLLEREIASEIKIIEQLVVDACHQANITLKPTRKTKFKWLREMHNSDGDALSSNTLL